MGDRIVTMTWPRGFLEWNNLKLRRNNTNCISCTRILFQRLNVELLSKIGYHETSQIILIAYSETFLYDCERMLLKHQFIQIFILHISHSHNLLQHPSV